MYVSSSMEVATCEDYDNVIMSTMAYQVTSLTIVYSTVYAGADQRKYVSSASVDFVRRIHRWTVNSPLKGPVTRKMSPFDDIMGLIDVTRDRRETINCEFPLRHVAARYIYV